ncbi:MAG TPA: allantoinase AllB [Terracidiphilus sp.]|nr:allantoinase AllB [Terracidiphilus sp.]
MAQAFRSTRVVTAGGVAPAALVVDEGRIVAVVRWDDVPRDATLVDFGDRMLLPGLVDTHVHINEPGRTEWEGFWAATRAAAAGGVTTLVDMPLNCIPETTNVAALEAKRAAAEGKAWVDWAAWGGVVRGNAGELRSLAAAGVRGFKCFLIDSGVEGFAWINEAELRLAFAQLRGTGLPLLAHAEVAGPVEAATARLNNEGVDWRNHATYLASRPDAAETEAIAMLIRLAEEFGVPVHVVHLATAEALAMLTEARRRGLPITVETCAHYLWFCAEEIADGATEWKCAPPIRGAENRERLWKALEEGLIDMVTTDHSPCPSEMKQLEEGRFDTAWGGIAGLGLALPVMGTAMRQRGLSTERLAEPLAGWMAAAPARLAGLGGRKGALEAGMDADFVVLDPDAEWTVTEDDLHFRHKVSPYIGAKLKGRAEETWLRGERVFARGEFVGEPRGRELVRR